MAGPARSKFAWTLGVFLPALFFLSSGSPLLSAVEGHVLAFAARFVAPFSNGNSVAIIAIEPETTGEQFARIIHKLGPAKAIGLVPPFPRSILSAASVEAGTALVQGAVRRNAVHAPARFPIGLTVFPGEPERPINPYAAIPGLLTGSPEPLYRVDMGLVSVFPSEISVLDFEPGPAPIYRAPLVQRRGDTLVPSFALRLAALAKGEELGLPMLETGAIRLSEGPISTDTAYRAYPRPISNNVPIMTAASILEGRFDPAGKVMLVGVVNSSLVEPSVFAGGTVVAPVVAEAQLTAALLDRALYEVPSWGVWAQMGVAVAVMLVLATVLPRLAAATGVVLALLLAIVVFIGELGMLGLSGIFLPLGASAFALLSGSLVLLAKKLSDGRWMALRHELASANRLLGQSYHTQGQLDAALERYRGCPVDEDLQERLYTLGMDFERRRQFGKAAATFAFLDEQAPLFRDAAERAQRNREADGKVVFGGSNAGTATGTLIMTNPSLARPVLGRYEVERELGRGAMGTVYLGRDPKIGRTVAIKTMALSHEFDGPTLAEVRERFFREAETAGRLAHPNIVTIYDVGEEQDLAYIAMDYLKGQSLAAFSQSNLLLPVGEVMTIIIQVAEALDYAHGQNVVHRDIKPANIVYDRGECVVKVTDFGVACLTDSSKTRTGTVLGSPSYMSPEQVAGRKVDGRSDLFSLGVTLFQLLTGELPFKGDSLASLMYQIANEKPENIRKLRPDLPACVTRLIGKALQKEPDRRYHCGSEMAKALQRCRENVKEEA